MVRSRAAEPGAARQAILTRPRVLADSLGVKVREIIEQIEADGWQHTTTRGSHRQYKHPTKPGKVTVPGKLSADLNPKTEASILRQAGLRR